MPSRRAFMAYAGAGCLAVTSIPTVTEPARGQAETSLDIPDVTLQASAAGPLRPFVTVDAAYTYDVNETPWVVRIGLQVDGTAVDEAVINTDETAGQGTVALSGPVTDAAGFDTTTFDVAAGAAKSVTVPVSVYVRVVTQDGTLAESAASQDVTVTVQGTSDGVAYIQATGQITAGDPSP